MQYCFIISFLICVLNSYPSVQAKAAIASGILTAFPNLRDKQGYTGYVSEILCGVLFSSCLHSVSHRQEAMG